MTTTISLQETTKEQLDAVLTDEGHTSQDSAVKSLLLYRELYLQTQSGTGTPSYTPSRTTTTTQPPSHNATNTHAAYIGKIGSGKTFTSKYHIHYQLEDDNDNDVIIIDPIDSYTEFTTRHGGVNIPASDVLGDPFAFTQNTSISNNDAVGWVEHVGIPFIIDALAARDYTVTDTCRNTLDERRSNATHQSPEVTVSDIADVTGPALPTSPDLPIDQAMINAISDDDFPALTTEFTPEFPDDSLVTINTDTTPTYGGTNIIGATLAAFTAAAARDDPVDLYIDNAHYLMATDHGKQILNYLLRIGRHYGVYLNLISQTVEEFLCDDEGTGVAVFDRFETVFLHCIVLDDETRTAIGLTTGEAAYINNAQVGNTVNYSEILVGTNGTWTPRRVEVSEELQKLIDPA